MNDNIIEDFLANAEELLGMGYYVELRDICTEFLQQAQDGRVYTALSTAEFALGNYDGAEDAARSGLRLDDKNPNTLYNLACIMKAMGRLSNAWRFFNRTERYADEELKEICRSEKAEIEKALNIDGSMICPVKQRKRALVIAAIYPPESGSGVQRTLKLVKYMRLFGWEPVVVTVPMTENPTYSGLHYFDELPDDIEVIRVPFDGRLSQENIETARARLLSMLTMKNRKEFERIYARVDQQSKLKLCCFPEPTIFWAYEVADNIEKYVDIDTIDLVYSTSGPYSDHFAGYFIKERFHKPWVVDFRDEWSNNPFIWPDKTHIFYRICVDCERKIINAADQIIAISEEAYKNYVKMGLPKEKLAAITNGYDEEDFESIDRVKPFGDRFTLVHNGLLYMRRMPFTVFKAIKNLIEKGLIERSKIIFHLGNFTDATEMKTVMQRISELGIEDIVSVTPYMEHHQSLIFTSAANILVLLLGDNERMGGLTGKIFEYLRFNRFVLCVGSKASLAAKIISQMGSGETVEFIDVKGIETMILGEYQKWLAGEGEVKELNPQISVYERKHLTEKHTKVFERALACGDKMGVSSSGDDRVASSSDPSKQTDAQPSNEVKISAPIVLHSPPSLSHMGLTAKDAPDLLKAALDCGFSDPMQSYLKMRQAFDLEPNLPKMIRGIDHPDWTYDPTAEVILESCTVCGSKETSPYYNAFSYKMADFRAPFSPAKLWMKCGNCGNLHTYGFPKQYLTAPADVKLIEPQENVYKPVERIVHALAVWSRLLNSIKAYTDGQSILEVGIGDGALLAVALEMGYETCAVELIESAAKNVSDVLGIPVWCADFLNFDTEKRFDIITMGDVIEHIKDPCAALDKAHSLLKPNGVLWISTPNFESSWTRMMKFNDAMWGEPGHITWFSRVTLERVLREHGFEPREYVVSSRYNGSMEIIATVKGNAAKGSFLHETKDKKEGSAKKDFQPQKNEKSDISIDEKNYDYQQTAVCEPSPISNTEKNKSPQLTPQQNTKEHNESAKLTVYGFNDALKQIMRLIDEQRYQNAISRIERCMKQYGKNIGVLHLYYGVCLNAMGKFGQAIQAHKTAIELEPSFSNIKSGEKIIKAPTYDEYDTPCIGCGSSAAKPIWVCNQSFVANNYGVINPLRVWKRCSKCGLTYAGRLPSGAALGSFYSHAFDATQPGGANYSFSEAGDMEGYLRYSKNRLDKLESALAKKGRVLDIGAGRGTFLWVAKNNGWDIMGIESSPPNCEYAKSNFDIDLLDIDFFDFESEDKFDAITMFEVIEHFVTPWKALEKCAGLLAKEGVLVIATPFRDSDYVRSLSSVKDFWWCEPSHLSYMDTRCLIERAALYDLQHISSSDSEQGAGRLELYFKKI